MILNSEELRQLYEAVVKPSGHPDPLGYMARAVLFSQGDPDYIDATNKQGFMPVDVSRATTEVGATEVQSLRSNVIATIAMDRNFYVEFNSIDAMIIAFHFNREIANNIPYSGEQKELIDALPEARDSLVEIMYPPLATVDDVIKLLEQSKVSTLTPKRKQFFKSLLNRAS